jgi:hypothetical protein
MANTITNRAVYGAGSSKELVLLINLSSDGSNETNTVVYNNSSYINNAASGSLMELKVSGSSCLCLLQWGQTTNSPIIAFNPLAMQTFNFRDIKGISNPNGTGATGNILLTTTGLASGNLITLELTIKQQ